MISIKVISEEVVKPSIPTPSHLHLLQSSLFDHAYTPVLLPLIFFYSPKIAPTNSVILRNLKASLPATLTVFYPLAGRVQDVNHITCNDEGVPYVVAEASSTCLGDVVHKADISQIEKVLPSHGNNGGYTTLLLAIQVTSFACGGVAIGLKMSHTISDAFSMAMFLKTWAEIANGQSDAGLTPRPCFDIWKLFPPPPPKNGTETELPSEPNPNQRPVNKWFLFSKADCDALKSRLCSCYINNNTVSLTMVLSAFIWYRIKSTCINSRVVNNNVIPHEVFHSVNIRPKVKPLEVGEDETYYFGNMVVNAIAKPCHEGEKLASYNNFTALVKESVHKVMGKCESFKEELEKVEEDLRLMTEHYERKGKEEITSLGFSSLRSLPVYEPDFGWGKPVWVTSATQLYKDMVIFIPAGPSSNDTVAYVNLLPDDMAKLEADQEFMSFVSKSASTIPSTYTSKL